MPGIACHKLVYQGQWLAYANSAITHRSAWYSTWFTHLAWYMHQTIVMTGNTMSGPITWWKDNAQQRSTQVMYVNTYWVCEIAKSLNHSPSHIGCGGKRKRKSYPILRYMAGLYTTVILIGINREAGLSQVCTALWCHDDVIYRRWCKHSRTFYNVLWYYII